MGKNFSLGDIQEGKFKDHLAPEDYDLEKRVSFFHIYLLPMVFSVPFLSFSAQYSFHVRSHDFPTFLCIVNCFSFNEEFLVRTCFPPSFMDCKLGCVPEYGFFS